MTLDAAQILRVLPHRYPFLFIDRVAEVDPGRSIRAQKLVSIADPILQGHFPGQPILPGVVQVEAMAQAAILLAHASGLFDPERQVCFFTGIIEAKFRAPVVPGDLLDIAVVAERLGRIGKFSGEIRCGEQVRSSARFTAVTDKKPAAADAG